MQSTVVPSLISPEELAALLENPLDLIVLDVSPTSNKSGLQTAHPGLQIPGARKADLKAQFSDPDRPWPNTVPIAAAFSHAAQALGVNHESRVVVYDNLGIYSAPRLWWLFRSMGHQQVSVLDGGLPAWIAAGLPTSPQEENNNYEAGNFEASLDEASVWSRDQVTANLAAPKALVIDARSAGRFAGTAAEPRIGLPSGHIPASCSLPFKSVLQGMKMKSKEELTQLFAELELGDQPLVFSCGSGLTACITLLAADQV
ncbi:MAG: sulfurtransferase, partial [Bacteroidota bacterium]